jgi:diguanylate cyclase (GGDEF)-like protein
MSVSPATHRLRRVLHLLLGGHTAAHRLPRDVGRLRCHWIETAGRIAQAESDREVRDLFAGFLTDHLGAAATKYVPTALSSGGLKFERMGETIEVTLEQGTSWTSDELKLVRQAIGTVDAILAAHARLTEVHSQSLTDPLTGLSNRRALTQQLSREILLARRHHQPLSLVALDVDHFKQINDTMGHAAGDDVLKRIASALTTILRRTDLVFRHGGDEFIVILPQTNTANAILAMEKVRRAMTQPTLSIGVAELTARDNPHSLLQAADEALYAAKRADRNCIRTAAAA